MPCFRLSGALQLASRKSWNAASSSASVGSAEKTTPLPPPLADDATEEAESQGWPDEQRGMLR